MQPTKRKRLVAIVLVCVVGIAMTAIICSAIWQRQTRQAELAAAELAARYAAPILSPEEEEMQAKQGLQAAETQLQTAKASYESAKATPRESRGYKKSHRRCRCAPAGSVNTLARFSREGCKNDQARIVGIA